MKTLVLILALLSPVIYTADAALGPEKVCRLLTRKGNDEWHASAFFVSPTQLLTAAHTFKKSVDQWIVKDGREVHCVIVRIDFKADIAVLECEEPSVAWYKLVGPITVVGYPFKKDLEQNELSFDTKIHLKGKYWIGMSGAPLVDENGVVVAMGVGHDMGKDGQTCKAIPASCLAAFLARPGPDGNRK